MKNFIASIGICSAIVAGSFIFSNCSTKNGEQLQENTVTEISETNGVIDAIMSRRSIRKYKDMPVEREKLQQIVECGMNAPSGMNKQPWQIRVVDNPEYIDGISEIFVKQNPNAANQEDFKNMFRNAPAVIFIASPIDGSGQLDCGLLGENIILAAQSLGLGTCCLGGPIAFMKNSEEALPYLKRLDIPTDYSLLYAIAVGYPDESPEAKPRDMNKVKFID